MTTMDILRAARGARSALRGAEGERRNAALLAMADSLWAQRAAILSANALDLEAARGQISAVMLDRLLRVTDVSAALDEEAAPAWAAQSVANLESVGVLSTGSDGTVALSEALTRAQAREVVDGLLAFGPRSVVVTSGILQETGAHVVWGYDHKTGEYFTLPYRFIKVHFPGTGDMFSAVLVGELLGGKPLVPAVPSSVAICTSAPRAANSRVSSASAAVRKPSRTMGSLPCCRSTRQRP